MFEFPGRSGGSVGDSEHRSSSPKCAPEEKEARTFERLRLAELRTGHGQQPWVDISSRERERWPSRHKSPRCLRPRAVLPRAPGSEASTRAPGKGRLRPAVHCAVTLRSLALRQAGRDDQPRRPCRARRPRARDCFAGRGAGHKARGRAKLECPSCLVALGKHPPRPKVCRIRANVGRNRAASGPNRSSSGLAWTGVGYFGPDIGHIGSGPNSPISLRSHFGIGTAIPPSSLCARRALHWPGTIATNASAPSSSTAPCPSSPSPTARHPCSPLAARPTWARASPCTRASWSAPRR